MARAAGSCGPDDGVCLPTRLFFCVYYPPSGMRVLSPSEPLSGGSFCVTDVLIIASSIPPGGERGLP